MPRRCGKGKGARRPGWDYPGFSLPFMTPMFDTCIVPVRPPPPPPPLVRFAFLLLLHDGRRWLRLLPTGVPPLPRPLLLLMRMRCRDRGITSSPPGNNCSSCGATPPSPFERRSVSLLLLRRRRLGTTVREVLAPLPLSLAGCPRMGPPLLLVLLLPRDIVQRKRRRRDAREYCRRGVGRVLFFRVSHHLLLPLFLLRGWPGRWRSDARRDHRVRLCTAKQTIHQRERRRRRRVGGPLGFFNPFAVIFFFPIVP